MPKHLSCGACRTPLSRYISELLFRGKCRDAFIAVHDIETPGKENNFVLTRSLAFSLQTCTGVHSARSRCPVSHPPQFFRRPSLQKNNAAIGQKSAKTTFRQESLHFICFLRFQQNTIYCIYHKKINTISCLNLLTYAGRSAIIKLDPQKKRLPRQGLPHYDCFKQKG